MFCFFGSSAISATSFFRCGLSLSEKLIPLIVETITWSLLQFFCCHSVPDFWSADCAHLLYGEKLFPCTCGHVETEVGHLLLAGETTVLFVVCSYLLSRDFMQGHDLVPCSRGPVFWICMMLCTPVRFELILSVRDYICELEQQNSPKSEDGRPKGRGLAGCRALWLFAGNQGRTIFGNCQRPLEVGIGLLVHAL